MNPVDRQPSPAGEGQTTKYKTHQEAEKEIRLKRLARIDRHTLLEGEMAELKDCSNQELQKLLTMHEATQQVKAAAGEVLRKRLDPEDQGTIEV